MAGRSKIRNMAVGGSRLTPAQILANAYQSRISADGGTTQSSSIVLRDFGTLYGNQAYWAMLRDVWSKNYGLKLDGSNNASKIYGLLGNDYQQGTLANQPNLDSNGILFNGTSDYLDIATDTSTFKILDNLIVSTWIRTASSFSGSTRIFASKSSATNADKSWFIGYENSSDTGSQNRIRFRFYGDDVDTLTKRGYCTTTNLSANTDYHVVLAFSGGTVTAWINKTSQSITYVKNDSFSVLSDSTETLTVGKSKSSSSQFDGHVIAQQILVGSCDQTLVNFLYDIGI